MVLDSVVLDSEVLGGISTIGSAVVISKVGSAVGSAVGAFVGSNVVDVLVDVLVDVVMASMQQSGVFKPSVVPHHVSSLQLHPSVLMHRV